MPSSLPSDLRPPAPRPPAHRLDGLLPSLGGATTPAVRLQQGMADEPGLTLALGIGLLAGAAAAEGGHETPRPAST